MDRWQDGWVSQRIDGCKTRWSSGQMERRKEFLLIAKDTDVREVLVQIPGPCH